MGILQPDRLARCPYSQAAGAMSSEPDLEDYDEATLEAHEYRVKRCRANECRGRIVWFKTPAGKNIPVDADTVRPDDDEYDYERHRPHFETCPAAKRFRGHPARGRNG